MTLPQRLTPRHFLLLVVVSIAIIVVLLLTSTKKPPALRAPIISSVVVSEVRRGELAPTLQLSGRLQPRLAASISAEVAGRVVERVAEPGQEVAAGTVLLRLAEEDYLDDFTRAEAQLEQERAAVARDRRLLALARQNRELSAREVKRLERLGSESLASVSRLDEARQRLLQLDGEEARLDYSVGTAASRIALRRAELERAERDLARCRITAPFAGTVNELLADVGDRLAKNQQVASLVALDALDLYAEIPGDAQTALTLGQSLDVRVGSEVRSGILLSLQREPDRKTHTLALRIRIPGEGLMPGALAETQLPLRPLSGVMLVPVSALLREDGKAYLFVEQGGKLTRREVNSGIRDGESIVILSGVEAGQRIVARDVAALSDGQQVKPQALNGSE